MREMQRAFYRNQSGLTISVLTHCGIVWVPITRPRP
jgi:hypothetical protein